MPPSAVGAGSGRSAAISSPDPLSALLDSLNLDSIGNDRFEGRCVERARPRVFGGELLAQMLMAASRTVDQRICHALHVDFLTPGRPADRLEYRVRRARDGRRFTLRQIAVWQRGREIALGTASFTVAAEDDADYQREPAPRVAGPEGLQSELEFRQHAADRMAADDRRWLLEPRGVEVRQVAPVPLFDPPPVPPFAHTWLRALGRLPDDPTVHRAVLAYASDMTLLDIACYPRGLSWIDPRVEQASLSHGLWFHRPFRSDEWLLYAQDVPLVAGARALARGSVFTAAGALVASVIQEGISRTT